MSHDERKVLFSAPEKELPQHEISRGEQSPSTWTTPTPTQKLTAVLFALIKWIVKILLFPIFILNWSTAGPEVRQEFKDFECKTDHVETDMDCNRCKLKKYQTLSKAMGSSEIEQLYHHVNAIYLRRLVEIEVMSYGPLRKELEIVTYDEYVQALCRIQQQECETMALMEAEVFQCLAQEYRRQCDLQAKYDRDMDRLKEILIRGQKGGCCDFRSYRFETLAPKQLSDLMEVQDAYLEGGNRARRSNMYVMPQYPKRN